MPQSSGYSIIIPAPTARLSAKPCRPSQNMSQFNLCCSSRLAPLDRKAYDPSSLHEFLSAIGTLSMFDDPHAHILCFAQSGHLAGLSVLARTHPHLLDEPESDSARTPLMLACAHGHVESARLLLHRGCDPSARDAQGLDCADHARSSSESPMELLSLLDSHQPFLATREPKP
jgi:hypothetical protein